PAGRRPPGRPPGPVAPAQRPTDRVATQRWDPSTREDANRGENFCHKRAAFSEERGGRHDTVLQLIPEGWTWEIRWTPNASGGNAAGQGACGSGVCSGDASDPRARGPNVAPLQSLAAEQFAPQPSIPSIAQPRGVAAGGRITGGIEHPTALIDREHH